jgi:hypothetical protein
MAALLGRRRFAKRRGDGRRFVVDVGVALERGGQRQRRGTVRLYSPGLNPVDRRGGDARQRGERFAA